MANTLGLHGDLDDVELIEDIERAFAVQFGDHEPGHWYTVDDVYRALAVRFPAANDCKGGCATAMAFYRIRRGLRRTGRAGPMRVDTPLLSSESENIGRLLGGLGRRTELTMPVYEMRALGTVGSWIAGLSSVAAIVMLAHGDAPWIALLLASLGVGMCFLDRGRAPSDCQTLGLLAAKVAGLNRATLIAEGAASRASETWRDLIEVLSDHTRLPKSEIRPDTWLLQSEADRHGSV